jgi:nitrogen regulatory protein PII
VIVRVVAFVRPHKLEEVKTSVSNLGVSGLTVTDVRGAGSSPERPTTFAGHEVLVALPIRSKLEVVVPAEMQEAVIGAIVSCARTGEPGDGKVFVEPILDVLRVRTGERGQDAV